MISLSKREKIYSMVFEENDWIKVNKARGSKKDKDHELNKKKEKKCGRIKCQDISLVKRYQEKRRKKKDSF